MATRSETIELMLQSRSDLRDFTKARREISSVKRAMDEAFAGIRVGGGMAIVNQAMSAASGAFRSAMDAAIGFNATLEQQEVAFKTLLGSAGAAQVRIAELFRFAAETPFEFEQILQASRILQSLTNGALASGDGLRLVGDIAAATARPLEEVAQWVGRVHAGLSSGTAIGEATLRLIEMGAISGATAQRLNLLAQTGAGVSDTMGILHREFGRFSGAMIDQSKTFNGQLSTLRDNLKGLVSENTKGFFDALKMTVESVNRALTSDSARAYVDWLQRVMDLVTLVPRAAGAISGGNVGPSNTANLTLQSQALEEAIRRTIKLKRDQGEIDDTLASKLAMQLRLVQLTEDAQERLRRGRDLSGSIRGAAPRVPATASAPEPPPLTDAHRKLSGELFSNFLEAARANLDARQRLEIDYAEQIEQVEIAFAGNSEARKAALFQVDRTFAAKRAALDEQELKDRLEREEEAATAVLEIQREIETAHRNRVQRELQRDSDLLEERRSSLAIARAQLEADFRTPTLAKRGPRLELLELEIAFLDEAIRKLKEKRTIETDPAAIAAIDAQLRSAFADQRGVRLGAATERGTADPNSARDQFALAMVDIQNQWGTAATQMAGAFESVFSSAINTVSDGITGLIMGTLTWEQALQNIGVTILTDLVQAIVQMGVRWVLTQIMMATIGKSIQAASVALNAGFAASLSAIWATPATLSTIASYGSAAAAAPAAIALAEGAVLTQSLAAFKTGGYTGDGGVNEPAGIVHRGEFVIPQSLVKAYGVDFFDRMMVGPSAFESSIRRGFAPEFVNNDRAPVPAHPAAAKRNVFNFAQFAGRSEAERYLATQEGERFLIDTLRRTQHEVSG